MERKIYVASSWRNNRHPFVVKQLLQAGHQVYDFKNPAPGNCGFHWSDIDPNWNNWTPESYAQSLTHPRAEEGFAFDFNAMKWADTFVLVMPCGRSAHLELGWAAGAGKYTAILLEDQAEPELMYKMVNSLHCSLEHLIYTLGRQM